MFQLSNFIASSMLSTVRNFASTANLVTHGNGMMKSLVKSKPEKGIWMERVPIPSIPPNHVMIKIKKTAICGTDVHIYNWDSWSQKTIPIPMTVGHEFSGEILELGMGVTNLHIGQRVSGEGHITCRSCRNCRAGKRHLCKSTVGVGVNRPGCFAEYLVIPSTNVFKLPNSVSDDIASIMDPFGNATHCALSFDVVGEDVLITGAGPISSMAVAILKHIGARNIVVTDINEYRLNKALEMGATRAINVNRKDSAEVLKEAMSSLGMTEGFDVGLEMSGNLNALQSMITVCNQGSKIALLGITPGLGIFVKGIYGREMYETWYKMTTMLETGLNITPIITHRFPIDRFQEGFDVMRSSNSGKVVLDWTI